jgi:hypothetical protein
MLTRLEHKSGFDRWLERTKIGVEILAIIIGGSWAYFHFRKTEEPGLAQNFKIESTLEWIDTGQKDICWANMSLHIENISKSPSWVRKVRREAWYFQVPTTQKQPIEALDVSKLAKQGFSSDELIEGPLIFSYPPSAVIQQEFGWSVKRLPHSYVVFKISLFEKPTDSNPMEYHYTFGPTCGADPEPVEATDVKTPKRRKT